MKKKTCKLEPSNKSVYFYNGTRVQPLGILPLNVKYKNVVNKINFYVMKNGGTPILRGDFMKSYNIGFFYFKIYRWKCGWQD